MEPHSLACRDVSTAPLSLSGNLELLNKQRALRPNSPHFTIYQPQLTWLSSIANRVTGSGLSVGQSPFLLAFSAPEPSFRNVRSLPWTSHSASRWSAIRLRHSRYSLR